MKEIKIDRYFVPEKGKKYEILKFPFIRHMWTVEEMHPGVEEGFLRIDGCKEAFCQMCYAFAVLANFPDKIIYFPCKQEGMGESYRENYHLVLCRAGLSFERSLWPRLYRGLDQKHYSGKFVLQYDRQKLDNYFLKELWNYYVLDSPGTFPKEIHNQMYRGYFGEIRKDTVFMVLRRTECYIYHFMTADALDHYHSGGECLCGWIGWILSDRYIRSMYQKAEKQEVSESDTQIPVFSGDKLNGCQ